MALHLIPSDDTDGHRASRECPCNPQPVDVVVEHADAEWIRQAWQHRGTGDAEGVEVAG